MRKIANKPFYKVYNKTTKRVYSKCTTRKKAMRQLNLLQSLKWD